MAGTKQPKLTEGQKDCLRLVDRLLTSKEIARELQISPFTVDQRLDAARRKLGAQTRKDAARIFAQQDTGEISQPIVYETRAIAHTANPSNLGVSNRGYGRNFVTADSSNGRWVLFKGLDDDRTSLRLTMPALGGEAHDFSRIEVAAAIVKTALFTIIALTAIVVIVTGLMQMLS